MSYTVIDHNFKKMLGIKDALYIVADKIYQLSVNPKAPVTGWCSMKKEDMAEDLDYSTRTLGGYFKRLRELGYIESSEDGKYCRTTDLYHEKKLQFQSAEVADGRQKLPMESAEIADTYKVENNKENIVCVFRENENQFFKIRDRFSSLNLTHREAATDIFKGYLNMGKYGAELTLSDILQRYETFMISYNANHQRRNGIDSVSEAIDQVKDYTNPDHYQ